MRIFVTALLSAIVLLSVSCEKEKNDSQQRKFISLKLDNQVYLSENPQGIINLANLTDTNPDNDYPTMAIKGTSYGGDDISLTLAAPVDFIPGAYPATLKGNGMVLTLNSSYYTTLTSLGSTDFVINITYMDNVAIEGTFSGTLKDVTGVGGSRVVKDGAFRVVVTRYQQ